MWTLVKMDVWFIWPHSSAILSFMFKLISISIECGGCAVDNIQWLVFVSIKNLFLNWLFNQLHSFFFPINNTLITFTGLNCLSICSSIQFMLFFSLFFVRQALVKRPLHMQYRVPVLYMRLQQPVPVAISRCAVVIQAIDFSCHMQNNWNKSKNRGNGAAARLTSILAWNLRGNSSMRVKLKAMPVVWWICTTIEPDERYVSRSTNNKIFIINVRNFEQLTSVRSICNRSKEKTTHS